MCMEFNVWQKLQLKDSIMDDMNEDDDDDNRRKSNSEEEKK